MVILGLLEDMHLYADDQPRRSKPNYFCNGPYFGDESLLQQMPLGISPANKENVDQNILQQRNISHQLSNPL